MGHCCHYYHHGPWCWEDPREFEYEVRPRYRERPERAPDVLEDLQERQRELERELAELREQVRAASS